MRERGNDILFLINLFTDEINKLFKDSTDEVWKNRTLSAEAVELLSNHNWPGNIRELRNTLTRMILWAEDPIVSAEDAEMALIKKNGSY